MATLTITSGNGELTIRDEIGNVIATVPSNTMIKSAVDSHAVVGEVRGILPGNVRSIDHAGEFVHIDCQPTTDMIRELCILTTRDDAGRHFTTWSNHYAELEQLGLCEISRPIHGATGIPYGCDEWAVQVTDEGMEVVDANPELHPA